VRDHPPEVFEAVRRVCAIGNELEHAAETAERIAVRGLLEMDRKRGLPAGNVPEGPETTKGDERP
jgi:hypothetical protein